MSDTKELIDAGFAQILDAVNADDPKREVFIRVRDLRKETADSLSLLRRQVEELEAKREWRCFHCNQVFSTRESAEAHFGRRTTEPPECAPYLAWVKEARIEARKQLESRERTEQKLLQVREIAICGTRNTAAWQDVITLCNTSDSSPSLQDERERAAREEERERCAKIAESEPEPAGDAPVELQLVPLEDALHAAVRATKKCIVAAIRSSTERTG